MALTLVPTHLGNVSDVTVRAREYLCNAEVIILEEFKESTKVLRALDIPRKDMFQLNEHSTPEDIQELFELCQSKNVAMISDCGTPNFCDPGATLVRLCRAKGVPVKSLPGPSSLMLLLSLSSERIDEFLFRGFIPAKTELRQKALQELKTEKKAIVLMDTPYRLKKLLEELAHVWPQRRALLGLNLTQENEMILEDSLSKLSKAEIPNKAEFVILLYAQ